MSNVISTGDLKCIRCGKIFEKGDLFTSAMEYQGFDKGRQEVILAGKGKHPKQFAVHVMPCEPEVVEKPQFVSIDGGPKDPEGEGETNAGV